MKRSTKSKTDQTNIPTYHYIFYDVFKVFLRCFTMFNFSEMKTVLADHLS